jgi:hypothetical protein
MSNPWFDLAREAYGTFTASQTGEFERDDAVPLIAAEIRRRGLQEDAITELAFRLLAKVDRFDMTPPKKEDSGQGSLFTDAELGRLIAAGEGTRVKLGCARSHAIDNWLKTADRDADRSSAAAAEKRRRIEPLRPWLDQGLTLAEAVAAYRDSQS